MKPDVEAALAVLMEHVREMQAERRELFAVVRAVANGHEEFGKGNGGAVIVAEAAAERARRIVARLKVKGAK